MNTELAMAALADAKANHESFDMNNFFSTWREIVKEDDGFQPPPCGTTACYAGFVSLRVAPKGSRIFQGYIYEPGGTKIHAEDYARDALDITTDQREILFYLDDIDQVERAVNHLVTHPDADGDTLAVVATALAGNA